MLDRRTSEGGHEIPVVSVEPDNLAEFGMEAWVPRAHMERFVQSTQKIRLVQTGALSVGLHVSMDDQSQQVVVEHVEEGSMAHIAGLRENMIIERMHEHPSTGKLTQPVKDVNDLHVALDELKPAEPRRRSRSFSLEAEGAWESPMLSSASRKAGLLPGGNVELVLQVRNHHEKIVEGWISGTKRDHSRIFSLIPEPIEGELRANSYVERDIKVLVESKHPLAKKLSAKIFLGPFGKQSKQQMAAQYDFLNWSKWASGQSGGKRESSWIEVPEMEWRNLDPELNPKKRKGPLQCIWSNLNEIDEAKNETRQCKSARRPSQTLVLLGRKLFSDGINWFIEKFLRMNKPITRPITFHCTALLVRILFSFTDLWKMKQS